MTLAPAAGPPSGTSSPPPIAFSVAAPGSAKSRIGEDEDESIGPARSGGGWGARRSRPPHFPPRGAAPAPAPPALTLTHRLHPAGITGAGSGGPGAAPPAPPAPPPRHPPP